MNRILPRLTRLGRIELVHTAAATFIAMICQPKERLATAQSHQTHLADSYLQH